MTPPNASAAARLPNCYLCDRAAPRLVVANATYSFLSCPSCGFRMQHPVPGPDANADLYGDDFYAARQLERGLDEQGVVMRGLITDRVLLLTKLNGGPGILLDVGAGTGLFVDASIRAGWDAQGIETSAAAVRIASRITTAPVRHQRLEDVSADLAFDAVTLWDVLEHLPDPRASLRAIARVLRPGGLAAISLPNAAGLKARLLGSRWRYYRREFGHVSHFKPSTLVRLLVQAGFTSVVVRTAGLFNLGKPFGLDPDAVRGKHRLLARMQSLADVAAGRVSLGENLLVVARPAAR